MHSSSKTTLGFLLRLFLGLLVVASVLGQVAADEKDIFEHEAEPRTRKRLTASKVQWMTPGCKHDLEFRQAEHLGMCSSDSIRMKVNGKIALLLDEAPWSVDDLSDLNDRRKLQTVIDGGGGDPTILLYSPGTAVMDGPLYVQNITIFGYLTIGDIVLSPSSNMSALQGPPG